VPEDIKKGLDTLKENLKEKQTALETTQNRKVKDERKGCLNCRNRQVLPNRIAATHHQCTRAGRPMR